MTSEPKLKPCPFCGCKPAFSNNLADPTDEFSSRIGSITLRCQGFACVEMTCGIHNPGYEHAKSILIEKWNTRPSPEIHPASNGLVPLDKYRLMSFLQNTVNVDDANLIKEGIWDGEYLADELIVYLRKFGQPAAKVTSVEDLVQTIKTTNISLEGQKALDRGEAVVISMKDIFKIAQAIHNLLTSKGKGKG